MNQKEKVQGIVYIVCPDPSCNIFNEVKHFPGLDCGIECPKKDEMGHYAICFRCNDVIDLGSRYILLQSVTHQCLDGFHPRMFPDKYRRVFEIPKRKE